MASPSAAALRSLAVIVLSAAVFALCVLSPSPASAAAGRVVPPGGGTAGQPAGNSSRCSGYADNNLPAGGDITSPARDSAGFFDAGGYNITAPGEPVFAVVCIRTVREWVRYTAEATKTWQVYIGGKIAAIKTFRLPAGYYFWTFVIGKDHVQPSKVCVMASGTPGHSCWVFTYLA